MTFRLRPILSEIKALYSNPISTDRFKAYLSLLQGKSKGDMVLPIGGFNPMAKPHILLKIEELQDLRAEQIMHQVIEEFNHTSGKAMSPEFQVVLNIADDLMGSWTNYYTTDFDSKFKLNALISRQFCVPYFWTSEEYSEAVIKSRTLEYLYRSHYRLDHSTPRVLQDYLNQEVFVASHINQEDRIPEQGEFNTLSTFYNEYMLSDEYIKIFNFFYGDAGAESLGFTQYGLGNFLGYDYAQFVANTRHKTPN